MSTESKGEIPIRTGAKDLVLKILKEANVRPDMLEHGRIGFHYGDEKEDEYIIVEADNEHTNIRLVDYAWYEINKWDIEKVTEIQSQLNIQNISTRPKVVYSFGDDDTMILTTLLTMPFFEGIPDIKSYFSAQLQCLVDTHNCVLPKEDKNEMVEQNEESKQKGGEA